MAWRPSCVKVYRITAPATDPKTGVGDVESVEIRTSKGQGRARGLGIAQLRAQGWEVDDERATVREVVPVIGQGTPAQRLRALRDTLGERPEAFGARFLVPATGGDVRAWEAGRELRPFELRTLAYLERALFGQKEWP